MLTVNISQNKFIAHPSWTISNVISLPTSDNTSGGTTMRSAIQFLIISNTLLETIFMPSAQNSGGSSTDQLNIFRSIEDSMGAMGFDGRGCLLRLICELQSNPIGEFTVIGEILTVLFTPKRGLNDFLHEYILAEMAGANGEHCPTRYPTCPFSLMKTVKQYKRFMEGFSANDDKPGLSDPLYANYDFGNNHIALPEIIYH
ncbi:uncharacterized protein LOC135196722 isoform X1 [Macrobrachium nipponense]|uniref:uncharacterized protein LOC135196722 isoform X1 n=1 Tax=Macrobrachium nipponense TaxID=159736 RepID=UPI0030C83904